MQRRRILGWLLIAPLAVNVGTELYLLALIALQGDNNDERWLAFSFLAFPLLVTAPLAYAGWRLLRGGIQNGENRNASAPVTAETGSASAGSGWVVVIVSVVVMVAALLEAVIGLTGIVSQIRFMAAVGTWILFAFPLTAGIKRIRSNRS